MLETSGMFEKLWHANQINMSDCPYALTSGRCEYNTIEQEAFTLHVQRMGFLKIIYPSLL